MTSHIPRLFRLNRFSAVPRFAIVHPGRHGYPINSDKNNKTKTAMNIKRIVMCALAVFALAITAQAQDADSLYAKDLLQPGTEAPDFTLPSPDGTTHTLSAMRGKYVVLDFWASWCPDCRKDIPEMKRLHEQYGRNIRFVSVSFDDKREAWTSCIEQNNLSWLQVSELKKWKETDISRLYHIKWIPAMYLIDRQGRIILSTVMIEKLAAKLQELHEL